MCYLVSNCILASCQPHRISARHEEEKEQVQYKRYNSMTTKEGYTELKKEQECRLAISVFTVFSSRSTLFTSLVFHSPHPYPQTHQVAWEQSPYDT